MPITTSPAPSFEDVWRTIQALVLAQQETDRQQKEADRQVKNLAKPLSAHGNRLGEFVQEMVRPPTQDASAFPCLLS